MTSTATQRTAPARNATAAVPMFLYGAGGMLAGELLRLCETHPALSLRAAIARGSSALSASQPHLATSIATCGAEEAEDALAGLLEYVERAAVVFALPHGESPAVWERLTKRLGARAEQLTVVDLAADFRLRDPELYRSAYGESHPLPAELERFVYGLPEYQRTALQTTQRAAAPGCFATAIQLATLPAAYANLLDRSRAWILHAVTGSSGSGNAPKPGTHHPHRHGNLWAYALNGHRHEAELAQSLAWRGISAPIQLVPHSGPFARGIHLTTALPLVHATTTAQVTELYADHYRGEPFVEVLREGVPDIRSVAGSNRASLAVSVRDDVLTVVLTLDNLVKGGAGQALQCLNLMLGFPETWGLPRAGMGVC